MKKTAVFLAFVMFLTMLTGATVFSTQTDGIKIESIDGEIAVVGTFDGSDKAGETYNVYLATYDDDGVLIKVDISEDYTVLDGTNEISFSAPHIRNVQHTKAYVWTKSSKPLCESCEETLYTLKVLGIGNSFTVDSMKWLYEVAEDYGIDNIVLGYAYKGGCSLETHWDYISNDQSKYDYYKYNTTAKSWVKTSSQPISVILPDEDWNLITLQQVSQYSGMTETFEPYLTSIIDYVNENKTNTLAQLAWQMTWAYQADSSHYGFANYDNDQMTMYNAIVDAGEYIVERGDFDFVIPVGTSIQNARTSYIGDTLTRDGYHLSYNLGRYIGAMTWFHKILGLPVDNIDWVPSETTDVEITEQKLEIVKESVRNAVNNPFAITNSQYEQLSFEDECKQYLDEYFILEWDPICSAFYYSTQGSAPKTTDSALLPYFICTPHFTKEDIPVGSIIAVGNDYEYRPEGWVSLDTVADKRGSTTSEKFVAVDEDWWGDDNYKAFNISKIDRTEELTDKVDEAVASFRILVPKSSIVTEYTELEYKYYEDTFYNSTSDFISVPYDSITASTNTTREKFIATKIFHKDELPNGTVLEVDSGYRYRPEGWVSLDTKPASRAGNVTETSIVIDDEWWGDYNYRAFNISYDDGTVIDDPEEMASHFRILVPKDAERLVELNIGYEGLGYYHSRYSMNITRGTDLANTFLATEIVTKDKIPVGSKILIETGYQYRPEGWITENEAMSSRPDVVTEQLVEIDDEWWGDYNYRAFNISKTESESLVDLEEYTAARFHILVPAQ